MTTQPSNESELQLYRVLQRANLLAYYDTFICQGGDDVQQLCEAGEEEFLEIMALVGMASKPLHVRRLQKVLQEWMTNPANQQQQQHSSGGNTASRSSGHHRQHHQQQQQQQSQPQPQQQQQQQSQQQQQPQSQQSPSQKASPNSVQQQNSPSSSGGSGGGAVLPAPYSGNVSTPSPGQFANASSLNEYSQPCSPLSMNPVLLERQIRRLAEAAENLVKNLPPLEIAKPLINGNKKRNSKEIEAIMSMLDDDPLRMEAIRKYAAIYGRFDCKRKPEKPLTLHEVSVNEAAAQICSKIPALLYRRDELFPLARQVVRDSGYQYSKGHSRSQSCAKIFEDQSSATDEHHHASTKRIRLESSPSNGMKIGINEDERKRRQDRLEGIVDQLKSLGSKQEELKSQIKEANELQNFQIVSELQNELEIIADHQMQLVNEKAELEKQQKRAEKAKEGSEKLDDDTDSQFSLYSNESTPSLLHDGQRDSPTSIEPLAGSSGSEIFGKSSGGKKKSSNASSGGSNANGSNSNDSIDFASKQILQDSMFDDNNLDLRLFNKYTEALRNAACFGAITPLSESSSPNDSSSANNRSAAVTMPIGGKIETHQPHQPHQHHHRPRGRPPKVTERELHSTFYEQIQAQMQQAQMLVNYQTHLQVQAALALGDFNAITTTATTTTANGANSFGGSGGMQSEQSTIMANVDNNNGNDKDIAIDFANQLIADSSKHSPFDGNLPNAATAADKDSADLSAEIKDEVVQSLNALISMANGEGMKHEMSLSSVEFKIA